MSFFTALIPRRFPWVRSFCLSFFFLLGSFFCLGVYQTVKNYWQDTSRNILAFTAGSGNTGYFGLPVAVAIFGEQAASIVILCIMGLVLYENSLGFFITARGHHTTKEALKKVFSLPSLYAFLLGLIFNLFHLKVGEVYFEAMWIFRGLYTLLGMMMIGFGLSAVDRLKFDFKFFLVAFLVRFFLWPAAIFFLISFDKLFFNIFTPPMRQVLVLMSIVPLAANTVAYASALGVQPAKASVAVLASTLFALFYIPLVVGVFLGGK